MRQDLHSFGPPKSEISIEFPERRSFFLRTPANKLVKPHKITHNPIYIEGLWKNIGMRSSGLQRQFPADLET